MIRQLIKGLTLLALCVSLNAFADGSKPANPPAASESGTAVQHTAKATDNPQPPGVNRKLAPRLPLNELRLFAEAFNRISTAYVHKIDDRTLLNDAIKGMLAELDPHSTYLDKKDFKALQEDTTGDYGGLGLEVTTYDGFIRVVSPMDGTPAAKAGIKPGDLIIKLNDEPVKGMSLSKSIDKMRGKPGSKIKLTILREGDSKPLQLTLTRQVIKVSSVRSRMLAPGYGYIRIAQFQSRTGEEVHEAVKKLMKHGKLKGLVLDLRNNPGGVLQSAVQVANTFISKGLIVYTKGRIPSADLRFSATTPDMTHGVPMVVLVNEGTASAAEIVSGALQDHKRAVIMGTRTFGKGSVQTILPLDNDRAIKLTTALYFTPNGRSIQAEGIVPNIWVDESKVTPTKANPFWIKERDLPDHLANPEGMKPPNVKAEVAEENKADKLAASDYQLFEALNLLKGINAIDHGHG